MLFVVTLALTFFGWLSIPGTSSSLEVAAGSEEVATGDLDAAASDEYQPTYEPLAGKELVLIYIGSSQCAFSTNPALPAIVESAKRALRDKALEAERPFITVGIVKDWIVENGVNHLATFGTFDEIMTGRSWMNEGVMRYIWQTLPGPASTPQLLVVERTMVVPGEGADRFRISDEAIVTRKVGMGEIPAWVEAGAPLPRM